MNIKLDNSEPKLCLHRSTKITFPRSRMILVPSESGIGFTAMNFQGAERYKWDTLFRPFLRIEGGALTDSDMGLGWFVRQANQVTMRGCLQAPDVLLFELTLNEAIRVYVGPAGTHVNFGGVDEQEFLMFWGFTKFQSGSTAGIEVNTGSTCAVLQLDRGVVKSSESGFALSLPAGVSHLVVAAGLPDEMPLLKGRVEQALATNFVTLMEQVQRDESRLLSKRPSGLTVPEAEATKAALWTVATTTHQAERGLKHEFLGACSSAYDKAQWLWDTCFAVRGYAAYDLGACEAWMQNFMDVQKPNGMLPGCISPIWTDEATQVPIFSWALLAMHEAGSNREFLTKACTVAVRNNDWWMSQGEGQPGGLPASAPISYDNSPLFDFCRLERMKTHERLVTPDMVACVVQDSEDIARLAGLLGDHDLRERMEKRAADLCASAWKHLYNDETEFFDALCGKRRIRLRISQGLMGIRFCPTDVAARIVERYVKPGSPAWRRIGLTTVFSDEPSYDPENFWRGMVWPGVNRLVAEALVRCGFTKTALDLGEHTVGFMMANDAFYEVYNPETGRGSRASAMSGLGAGVFLDFTTMVRELKKDSPSTALCDAISPAISA